MRDTGIEPVLIGFSVWLLPARIGSYQRYSYSIAVYRGSVRYVCYKSSSSRPVHADMRGATAQQRGQGHLRHRAKLPSGRYRAMYYGPEGKRPLHRADHVHRQARGPRPGWRCGRPTSSARRGSRRTTRHRRADRLTLADYAEAWLAQRDLKARTREHYAELLDRHLLPAFGALPLASITADDVRAWHDKIGWPTPTLRAHCYGLLRTIMAPP